MPLPEPLAAPARPGRAAILALLGLGFVAAWSLPSQAAGRQASAPQQAVRAWTLVDVREASYAPGSLLDPRGVVALADGRFLVADAGHRRIAVVDSGGAVVGGFGEPGDGPAGLDLPTDVAADVGRDRVYVADYGNRRLAVFTTAGLPVALWRTAGSDQPFAPSAVAVAAGTGDVYVISRVTGGRVEQFAADGTWIRGWGGPGADPGQFNGPEDLAVDAAGKVLVADSSNGRIQIFSADGQHEATWPGLLGARDVAVSSGTGRVYVLLGTEAVQVMLPTGVAVSTLRGEDMGVDFRPAVRLAVGAGDRVALTTGSGSADGKQGLRQYATDGRLLADTATDPLDHPGFVRPEAIDVAPGGELLVLDGATGAAGRYDADGALVGRLTEATGAEIAVAPDGTIHVADRYGRLRSHTALGAVTGERTHEGFVGLGLAADTSHLYVTEALTHAIGVMAPTGSSLEPHGRLRISDPPYAWPLDLDVGPDGRIYTAGGDNGRVDVVVPDTGAVESWPSGGSGAERVSVADDGTVFLLRFDGTVAVFSASGSLEAEWRPEPSPGRAAMKPLDLAAGPAGRLYVLDGRAGDVHVYSAVAAEPTPATPESTPDSPCMVTGRKVADPASVEIGGEVAIRLSLGISCPEGSQARADVVLVMDRSNSMAGLKLADAKEAAEVFVAGLDLSRHRVALVTFSDAAALEAPLSSDGEAVRAAIRSVQAHGTTNIAAALGRAARHIQEAGRSGSLGVIVLLTDGEPTGSRQAYVDTVRQGARARAAGDLLYSIGLGVNVDEALLASVAGSADRYFFAPEASGLAPIYEQLSATVGSVVASDVQVIDEVGTDVNLVAGSPSGRAVVSGRRVTWSLGAVPQGGLAEMNLRVVPTRLGRVSTNRSAVALYTAGSSRYTFTFPIPEVEVLAPSTATSTPTPSATPTPRPTTGPSVAFLPVAMRPPPCPGDKRKPADIVLVVDASTSMRGAKMAAAVEAARRFVALVQPERDRVGLVGFNSDTQVTALTTDLASINRALAALHIAEGTRIDLGLYEATSALYHTGREEASHVAIMLSDGQPLAGTRVSALEQADLMDAQDITLFTIGMGADSDQDLLQQMATSPRHYYHAPQATELGEIYERIAVRLPCE